MASCSSDWISWVRRRHRYNPRFPYALYASDRSLQKDLAIQGDGSLEIIVDDPNCRSNMSVGENATLNVIGAASTEESWGIECAGIFTAIENATINSEVDIVDGVQDLQKP